jgi:hypothetical protein
VLYVNGSGPIIMAGYHAYPGRYATIRVDSGQVMTANRSDAKNTKILSALKMGNTAFLVYHAWPEGEERAEVDVSGFADAHNLLLQKVKDPAVSAAGLASR